MYTFDIVEKFFLGSLYMKLADDNVTGQLIVDDVYRKEWIALVRALQEASEIEGGPLEGWVFHGTDESAAALIAVEGLCPSAAILHDGDGWIDDEAVHFGSANVAAFFAEDLIESTENPRLRLVLLGARLEDIARCGSLGTDGQMIDCPLYSRLRKSESEVARKLEEGMPISWQECFDVLETVTVQGIVPPQYLHTFRSVKDLDVLIERDSKCERIRAHRM